MASLSKRPQTHATGKGTYVRSLPRGHELAAELRTESSMVAASLYHLSERARLDLDYLGLANKIEEAANIMEGVQRQLRGTLLVDGGSPADSGYLMSERDVEE